MAAPDPSLTRSARWRDALDSIPTAFGRLVFLRSLPDAADRATGYAALQAFSCWLRLGLPEQVRDLRAYLAGCDGPGPSDFAHLVPPAARDLERQLFLADIETLVGLLRVEGNAPPAVL